MAGLENGGWKVTYGDKRSDYWMAEEEQRKVTDLTLSLGVVVKGEGVVEDVEIGGAVQKAGVAPGAHITSVNGRQFTAALLREAVQNAAVRGEPIELVVKNGDYFSTHRVDYRGGERYPHLERESGKPDLLTEIVRPRLKQ